MSPLSFLFLVWKYKSPLFFNVKSWASAVLTTEARLLWWSDLPLIFLFSFALLRWLQAAAVSQVALLEPLLRNEPARVCLGFSYIYIYIWFFFFSYLVFFFFLILAKVPSLFLLLFTVCYCRFFFFTSYVLLLWCV